MHKNFDQVMQEISHIYTLRPVDITSIPKSLQNTNRQELKRSNAENTKQRLRSRRSRTSFNELERDLIFLNNKRIESQSIHFIIFSWSRTNEKNSNFQMQHERSAVKWKNHKKDTVHNELHQYLKCKTLHGYIHPPLLNISGSPILMTNFLSRY